MKLHLLLLIQLTFLTYTKGEDCLFDNDKNVYNCNGVKDAFKSRYFGNFPLECFDCNITNFDRATFKGKNSLRSFTSRNSSIRTIGEGAFYNLRTINFLNLQDNLITNISANAFKGLTELYEMHLDRNYLTRLNVGFVAGVSANTVSLHGNLIGELSVDSFKDVMGITSLNLSSNNMYLLHPGSFRHLAGLEILDLNENKLCHIPLGALQDVPSLKELNLANNRLSRFYMGTFSGLRELVKLNVSHNRLKHFDDNILIPLIHLNNFDISGNQILYLDAHTLYKNAPSLRYISVNDNLWSCRSLTIFISYLQNQSVDFSMNAAKHYEVTNVHGIACSNEFVDMENVTFEQFLEKVTNDYESYTRLSNYC